MGRVRELLAQCCSKRADRARRGRLGHFFARRSIPTRLLTRGRVFVRLTTRPTPRVPRKLRDELDHGVSR